MSLEQRQTISAEPAATTQPLDSERRVPGKPGWKTGRVAMPADAAARQGRVAKLSWDALGERDAVVAFLNTHDHGLGGRPIDLAIADPIGLARVEAALATRLAGRVASSTPAPDALQDGLSENPDRGRAALPVLPKPMT